MFFNKQLILTGIATAIIVASCAPALYQPMPEQASASSSYEDLVKGRSLYVSMCGSCHSLYLPEQYNEKTWRHNLEEMQKRSKISDQEKALILAYLTNAPSKQSSR